MRDVRTVSSARPVLPRPIRIVAPNATAAARAQRRKKYRSLPKSTAPRRGRATWVVPWFSSGMNSMYWATTPKARVTTAKYRPGSRRATAPMITLAGTDSAIATGIHRAKFVPRVVSSAAVKAPSPTKAACDNDTAPAQPVRTVSDRATIA